MEQTKKKFKITKNEVEHQTMVWLGILFVAVFCYIPMFGCILAFKEQSARQIDVLKIIFEADFVGLENFDINSTIGEDGANLSGGERNRLQVALAIATDADILILDEPTAGIDKVSAEKFVGNLIEATKNRTLIIITHDSNYFSEMGRIELVHEENLLQRRQRSRVAGDF